MSGARIALNSIPMAMPSALDIKVNNIPCMGELVYDHNVGSVLMCHDGAWRAISPGTENRDECDRYECAYCHALSKEEKCPSCGAPRTGVIL